MSDVDDRKRLTFLGRPLPSGFTLRVMVVAPGATRPYHESDWRDALVVVERGAIHLIASGGSRLAFSAGDVLCLVGLAIRAFQNHGPEPAVLVAVSRRHICADRGAGDAPTPHPG